jgi:hypothetical protein
VGDGPIEVEGVLHYKYEATFALDTKYLHLLHRVGPLEVA